MKHKKLDTEGATNSDLGTISGLSLLQAKELFAKLTDNERMEVLNDYCTYCGQNERDLGKCYCNPCYDE